MSQILLAHDSDINLCNCIQTMSEIEETYIEIPMERLSEEALNSLIEEFILREGTDYGHSERSLEEKKTLVLKQLKSGKTKIVYSTLTENTTLMLANELQKLR